MNIILTDTEEFPPAPKNDDELKRRDWEEIWLPRSQRLDGDLNWSYLANWASSTRQSTSTTAHSHLQDWTGTDRGGGDQGDERGALGVIAEIRDPRGGGMANKGSGMVGKEKKLEARDLEKAGSEDIDSDSDRSAARQGQSRPTATMLEGWKWEHGRGPGRYTGMVMVPGRLVAKIELGHGGP